MIDKLWAFLKRDFRTETSYRFPFLLSLAGIFFTALTFYFISELFGEVAAPYLAQYDGDYFSFVIIGIAFSGYFGVGLNGFGRALRRAQTTGTLEAMIMTPAPISLIVMGSALWSYVFATFRVLVYLLLGTLVFTLNMQGANYLAAFTSLGLSIIAFASIGIMAAALILVIKRGEALTALFGSFANLIGGIYYPVQIMPEGLQFIAKLIPITYAVRSMRLALLSGASWSTLAPDLVVLAGFAVVLLPLSLWLFHLALGRAQRDGSLAHY